MEGYSKKMVLTLNIWWQAEMMISIISPFNLLHKSIHKANRYWRMMVDCHEVNREISQFVDTILGIVLFIE